MRYIKMLLFFLGTLFGIVLIGFFGLIGYIGIYGVFATLWEYCPNILIGSGLFVVGVLFVTIGWCKYCIPYKGNEVLFKTNKDCDDYFKTWQK